jgi:hypothetical protein
MDIEISPEAYRDACESLGVDPETYEEGSDPSVEAKAEECQLNRNIIRAESIYESDR